MYLTALSIGYAIPRADFNTTVHSVFRSAVNLRLTKGGRLLTLVTSSEADLPQGIRVDTPDDFSFEIFHTGEQGTCWNDILRLGPLTIDLSDARRWKCDLPALKADLTNPAASTAWRHAWQMLNKRQLQSNTEIVAENLLRSDETVRVGAPRKAGEAMQGLVDATRQCDLADVSPLRALIGLGVGLTPSGDDLLVGYLAGLWCSVLDESERIQFVADLGKAVLRLSRRTNDISRIYLYHAARGQVSSRMADLAGAICHGATVDRLAAVAESAMQVGHTSGMDAVTGLLIGLAVWGASETPAPGVADIIQSLR
jgi:hypothetical protein